MVNYVSCHVLGTSIAGVSTLFGDKIRISPLDET